MKIGIIGAGMVGQALGAGFAAKGHRVMLGTREPSGEKIQRWVRETDRYYELSPPSDPSDAILLYANQLKVTGRSAGDPPRSCWMAHPT